MDVSVTLKKRKKPAVMGLRDEEGVGGCRKWPRRGGQGQVPSGKDMRSPPKRSGQLLGSYLEGIEVREELGR